MADAWELARFGTLDRDGTRDFDGDGILDLDEYLNGRKVPIELSPGTNLIAYPHQVPTGHDSCTKLLAALGGRGEDSLSRLDGTSQTSRTCTATGDEDFAIVAGEGYVLTIADPASGERSLLLDGIAECTAPALSAGVNLRGHPLPPADLTCGDWLVALGAGTVSAIQRLDPRGGRLETCAFDDGDPDAVPVGSDFRILPGEGYRLSSPAGGSLTLPGCLP